MDSQCKMVRELLSILGQGKLLVKETSSQVGKETDNNFFVLHFCPTQDKSERYLDVFSSASEAGFQHLPSDPLRNLLAGPGPTLLS